MIILRKMKNVWKMYPIGSPKGALNNRRKPEFIGTLKFKHDDSGFNLNKYIKKIDNDDKLYPPADAINFLRSQAVFLDSKDPEMEEFLNSLNIKVRHTTVCPHCIYEGYVTIINKNYSFSYHNQNICKECAEETIKREMKLRRYDKSVFRTFRKVLEKTGNLDTVLEMLSPKFDPLKHNDLTLFDKINVNSSNFPEVSMSRLKVPKPFKDVLTRNPNAKLLPVQLLALREGVMRDEDMLVVSATGSGKTLIGEFAGIPKALEGKKFVFLTPLVALANQKYRDFKKKYGSLGLKVAIKVGSNRIKAKGELKVPDSNISDADIVVGTYEGLDFMLRSGKKDLLSNLGVVCIDEIHSISDPDRGLRLNGLINRIRNLYPNTQLIGLSATVHNSKDLANAFDMKLVEYNQRPVPLERHLVFVRNEIQKRLIMRKLVVREFHSKSSKGFNGQTIIFTNSRRKTHKIANFLSNKGINASAYHAGLSYYKKERIEKNFAKGKIAAVVTTAALAAGVDFPASQVIFESLLMGNKWISPNEFSQMLGRAGRPSYHDRGLIYLLPEIDNEFDNETEESTALNLLESDVEDVHVNYTSSGTLEEILADISSESLTSIKDIHNFYNKKPIPIELDMGVNELIDNKMINVSLNNKVNTSKYGRAVSMSFLSTENGRYVKNSLERKDYLNQFINKPYMQKRITKISSKKQSSHKSLESKNQKGKNQNNKPKKKNYKDLDKRNPVLKVENIALDLGLFENAYLSPIIHKQISNSLKMNFSTRLFSESTLDIISTGEVIAKVDKKFQEPLLKLQIDFLRCRCNDRPFCDCLQRGVSLIIIEERLKHHDPVDISNKLFKDYQIQAYPGDIFSWLDTYVRNLDAIKRICYAFNNKKSAKACEKLIKIIEKG